MARITVVATGGTRAPTQLELADRFQADGHEVRCIATTNALRFITSHIARRPRRFSQYVRLYRPQLRETFAYYNEHPRSVPHVSEGQWADVVLMCPASCNSVGKLAAGMNDNYALLVVRALPREKRVLVVPSMNPEMWFDPQFQRNVDLLNATEKYRVLCPTRGRMLSGDYGFGAQVSVDEIVAETYAQLGILSGDVEAALLGHASVPWQEERPVDVAEAREVALIDEDGELRDRLARALRDRYADLRIHQYAQPGQAMAEFREREPALIVTELAFSGGASARDLLEEFRAPGRHRETQIIATSASERREAGAEALARLDVLFLPKPLNVEFAVGMIGGCLQGGQRQAPVHRRRLEAQEVLFEQGDVGDELYYVEQGLLSIIKRDQSIATELRSMGPGEIVGEMAFFTGAVRTATVFAVEPTAVLVIKVGHATDYLSRQPQWLQTLIDTLASRVLDRDREAVAAARAARSSEHV